MSLDYARYMLGEWGRWSRDPPALSSNWRLWFTGSSGSQEMPAHVELVNNIVNGMEREPRIVVITHYCRVGQKWKKAKQIDKALPEYCRLLDMAEWHVHIELDSQNCQEQNAKSDRAVTLQPARLKV